MNTRATMRTAGVADDTLTDVEGWRSVFLLKKSPHPGMKTGVLKNQRRTRMMNRMRTCHSCVVIFPRALFFCKITFLILSSWSELLGVSPQVAIF